MKASLRAAIEASYIHTIYSIVAHISYIIYYTVDIFVYLFTYNSLCIGRC